MTDQFEAKEPRSVRRLTLADSLILIAAVAVGLAIARIAQTAYRSDDSPSLIVMGLMSIYWASLMVMVSLIPMRLMNPRPPWRRVRRQPGFIACAAVAFGVVHRALYFGVIRFWQPAFWANYNVLSLIASPTIGWIIISAWFVLAVSGPWRPEPSWIDRSGRVLAIAWIVRYLIHLVSGTDV
jgi:drug/metabolite transporter (DMT)-like permease